MILHGDLETFSATSIKDGTYIYAANCEIMLFGYAIDDGDVSVWDLTTDEKMPGDLEWALQDDDCLLNFQNSMFDRTVMRLSINVPHALWLAGHKIERWRDTMVKALSHSLPGGLEKTGAIMGLPEDEQKVKEGRAFIHLFCKPRPANSTIRRATRRSHPVEWAKFKSYCASDIISMRGVDRKLPSWNYTGAELDLWHLDQRINDRGIHVDLDFANAAIATAEKAKALLAKRTRALTNNDVERATQRDRLLGHILMEYGVDLPDLQASTLERRINDPELPQELRELLDIRMQASMGSSSKYKSLVKAVSPDGRLRGLLQFNGANRTGRWAGRTFQPQNLFRPPEYISSRWEESVEAIRMGAADLVFSNVMEATAACVRGALIAPKGRKLVVADLSNIEGRDQAWLAGESWKLRAFAEFDAGRGEDLYKVAYAKSFGVDVKTVTKKQRQIGKVEELMFGYEGGVGACITGALTYGFEIADLAAAVRPTIPAEVFDECRGFWDWILKQRRSTFGLTMDEFIGCDGLKRMWRGAHGMIVSYWPELQSHAAAAINRPGNTFECRKLKFRRDGAWLRIGLPSGRALCYPQPQVDEKGRVSYMGVNQYTRKWQRIHTYGGKIFENVCQAVARDVMAANMPNAEAQGYEIVLTVHDELITETPDSPEFNVAGLSKILSTVPAWAEGMPLAAGGWEGYRYKKE